MTEKRKGYLIFLAALGVMLGLISGNIAELQSWHEVFQPQFVASVFVHLSAVIAAFVGGKLVPNK